MNETLKDDGWIMIMLDEHNQFQRNYVKGIMPKPFEKNIIRIKLVSRNKLNEQGEGDLNPLDLELSLEGI
ncbi:hypothetical protein MTR_1g027720 [Medicago truncatula]|uniref:Uncharacterized protein n=1 Tax=Medicago truncatula TaxID=3880 RepID=A0A072VFL7_MEDTR|nr:hypothetical protein MTR_1g027720 [Medicago truncatula]